MAAKLAARFLAHTAPKSPHMWRRRIVAAFNPCRSSRSIAPGVATTFPSVNTGNLRPTEDGGNAEARVERLSLGFIGETSFECPSSRPTITYGGLGAPKPPLYRRLRDQDEGCVKGEASWRAGGSISWRVLGPSTAAPRCTKMASAP